MNSYDEAAAIETIDFYDGNYLPSFYILRSESMEKTKVTKGEIYYTILDPVIGSEQGGLRPCVILQNDTGNEYSPTTIIAPITTQEKPPIPMHIELMDVFLIPGSTLLLEQIRAVDKTRLRYRLGILSKKSIDMIDEAIIKNFINGGDKYG